VFFNGLTPKGTYLSVPLNGLYRLLAIGYRLFLVLAIRTVSLDLFPIPPSSRYEPLHHLFDHGRTRKR
jgi:hypothetical protein